MTIQYPTDEEKQQLVDDWFKEKPQCTIVELFNRFENLIRLKNLELEIIHEGAPISLEQWNGLSKEQQ